MSSIGKIRVNEIMVDDTSGDPIEDTVGPAQATLDMTRYQKCSIQVDYDPGATDDIKLQASNEENSNYADVPDSAETMDVTGGSVLYNIKNINFKYLRLVLPAAVPQTARFVGTDLQSN